MSKPVSPREAVALYIGEDYADMRDREYQPGKHGGTVVYSWGDLYVFALPLDRQPTRTVREAFPSCAIVPAEGDTAAHVVSRGKRVWLVKP